MTFEVGEQVVLTRTWQYSGKSTWTDVPTPPPRGTVGTVRSVGGSRGTVRVFFVGFPQYPDGLVTDTGVLEPYTPAPSKEEVDEAVQSILHGRRVWTLAEVWEEGYLACLDGKHQVKDNPFA